MADRDGINVLGCGMVTPFAAGCGAEVLRVATSAECAGEARYWSIPDSMLDRYGSFSSELKRERGAWISAGAIVHACENAGVALSDYDPPRIALVLGCAFAGQLGMIQFAEEVREQSARFVSPIHFPQTVGNYVAGALSRAFSIQGPNLTLASGETAGMGAIATACALLSEGAADIAVAGGVEVLSDAIVRGMGECDAGDGSGRVWAEGACMYVLQAAGGASERPPRAIITDWSAGDGGSAESCEMDSVAALVGRSLSAESAARLEHAICTSTGPIEGRQVVHRSKDHGDQRLVISVPA